jgi:hypothetical protein
MTRNAIGAARCETQRVTPLNRVPISWVKPFIGSGSS